MEKIERDLLRAYHELGQYNVAIIGLPGTAQWVEDSLHSSMYLIEELNARYPFLGKYKICQTCKGTGSIDTPQVIVTGKHA